jgi:glucose/arabinose dehydrogenase
VETYAAGLEHPTAMAWGPEGRLYVTQDGGTLVAVRRGARRPVVVASGLLTPLGLVWRGRTLFVSEQGRVERFTLKGTRLRGRRVLVRSLPFGRHQQDNIVIREDELGTRRRPEPAETVVVVERGAFYGWPRCWPSFRLKRLVGRCAGVNPPIAYLEPHSSADGIAFYTGASFPSRYRGDLFVALWGQYLSERHGRRVVRIELDDEGRARGVTHFAGGFDHPLALAVDRLGALLVADWGRGVVYRIQARGKA